MSTGDGFDFRPQERVQYLIFLGLRFVLQLFFTFNFGTPIFLCILFNIYHLWGDLRGTILKMISIFRVMQMYVSNFKDVCSRLVAGLIITVNILTFSQISFIQSSIDSSL